jgi:HTH-type transcriptional regulator/antitoxin HigA
LRFDRLDNFWFCLAHELAHVALHLGKRDIGCFLDDLESKGEQDGAEPRHGHASWHTSLRLARQSWRVESDVSAKTGG